DVEAAGRRVGERGELIHRVRPGADVGEQIQFQRGLQHGGLMKAVQQGEDALGRGGRVGLRHKFPLYFRTWRQGPSCPGSMGQDRRARRAKFGTARPCRVATLGKGREASGARPQPETARERTRMYVTEPETASHAAMPRRASYRPAPLLSP